MAEYETGEWSARFLRLRIEIIVCAMMLFLFYNYGFRPNEISIFPFRLQSYPSTSLVLISIFILYIYLVVAIYYRSKTELQQMIKYDRRLDQHISEINSIIERISDTYRKISFEKIEEHLLTLDDTLKNAFPNSGRSNESFRGLFEEYINKLKERINEGPFDPDHAERLFNTTVENIIESGETWISRFEKVSDNVVTSSQSAQSAYISFRESFFQDEKKSLEKFTFAVSEARNDFKALTAELNSLKSAMSIERLWVTFYVPIGFSIVLVLITPFWSWFLRAVNCDDDIRRVLQVGEATRRCGLWF